MLISKSTEVVFVMEDDEEPIMLAPARRLMKVIVKFKPHYMSLGEIETTNEVAHVHAFVCATRKDNSVLSNAVEREWPLQSDQESEWIGHALEFLALPMVDQTGRVSFARYGKVYNVSSDVATNHG